MSAPLSSTSHEQPIDGLEGFILTGGASSRMGSDKAQLKMGEYSFTELIATALSAVAHPVRSVSATPAAAGSLLRLTNVPDIFPQWGALGGLHAALAACNSPWAVVV